MIAQQLAIALKPAQWHCRRHTSQLAGFFGASDASRRQAGAERYEAGAWAAYVRRWGLQGHMQRVLRSAVCSPRARAACCCAAARCADARPGPLKRSAAPAPHPGGETLGGVKKKKKKSKKDKGDAAEEPGGDEAAAGGGGEGSAAGAGGADKKGAPGINVKGHSYEQEFDLEMKRLQVRARAAVGAGVFFFRLVCVCVWVGGFTRAAAAPA